MRFTGSASQPLWRLHKNLKADETSISLGTDLYPHMPILRPHVTRFHERHISSMAWRVTSALEVLYVIALYKSTFTYYLLTYLLTHMLTELKIERRSDISQPRPAG